MARWQSDAIVCGMANILIRPEWHVPERLVTPEPVYRDRRRFLRELGFFGAGALAASHGLAAEDAKPTGGAWTPAKRHPDHSPDWTLSDPKLVTTYNNYYEFSTTKDRVHKLVKDFVVDPWSIEIGGLCEKPRTVSLDELITEFPAEERVYRFRCVEAWAMVVPWTGFPLAKLVEAAKPKAEAKFVKFVTVNRPEQMPGIRRLSDYPWPYTEGLRLDEARHPLAFMATGLYGKPLPKQNGAPVRLVVPWKYGYKSGKSIVKIEFTAQQPETLWETLNPQEYPFESNVDPRVPHPRWSQATERMIDTGDRVPTQYLNGYAAAVAALYPKRKA
jgi:methionine sulfoxide reductase catalytic subunit